ncbi:MAG: hypothetical protein IPM16_08620 [Chloroflexi bacterium]|nr:hypothetical protein [Chloroflexota bacterium]
MGDTGSLRARRIRRTMAAYLSVFAVVLTVGFALALESSAQTAPPQASCSALVLEALAATDRQCSDTARNHACYGHVLNTAVPQPDAPDLIFEAQGHKVPLDDVQILDLSPLDVDSSHWGVVLIQAQASLPDTLPGQNVTFVLFGDVEVENAVGNALDYRADVTATAMVLPRPGDERTILARLTAGSAVYASGKYVDPHGELWVRVGQQRDASVTGWVTGRALSTAFDRLPDIDPNAFRPRPMQAFYFRTGIGRPTCAEAPRDGMVIQSPRGAARVQFTLNGVAIDLGSTAYVSSTRSGGQMCVSLLDGSAGVESGGVSQVVLPGERSCVPVDSSGVASGAPNEPEAFDPDEIALIEPVLDLLPEHVDIPEPAATNTPRPVFRPVSTRVPADVPIATGETSVPVSDAPPQLPTNAVPAPTRPPKTPKPTRGPTETPLPAVTAVITPTP